MKKIIIVGAGGIGKACGLILLEHFSKGEVKVELADISVSQCERARRWIYNGLGKKQEIEILEIKDLASWNPTGDILLDCTPGRYSVDVAKVALKNNMHYANLTEHVSETKEIISITRGSENGFILQTGLAPGFINVFTNCLVDLFEKSHPEIQIEHVKMRVGALSPYVTSPSYYAFTWSPVGVSTEYLNDAEVLKKGKVQMEPSLSQREDLIINGELFEADLTSGGASDLPDYYKNKIENLEYKTLRYPGHYSRVDQLKEMLGNDLNPETLKAKMLDETSFQEYDRVLIYSSVAGRNEAGYWMEKNKHLEVRPVNFNGIVLTGIQRTTASALCQSALLLMAGNLKGPVLQSQIPTKPFLSGLFIEQHYGNFYEDFK